MKGRNWLLGQAIVAVLLAVACGSAPPSVATSTVSPLQGSANPTGNPTAQPSPTSSLSSPSPNPPSPTVPAILDGRFGILVPKYYANEPIPGPIGVSVRRETDQELLFTLVAGSGQQALISPDGYRAAYWVKNELRVTVISPNERPRTLLMVSAKGEYGYNMAWSSDSTGIVVAVIGGGGGAADAPPGYSAIRLIDIAGGSPREIARITNANVLPLAWDRTAHLVVAYEPVCCGTINYDTITEDGTVKRVPPTFGLFFFKASQDAKFVFGTDLGPTTLVRVWPVDSYADGITIRSGAKGPIKAAEWRPGSDEIGVLFENRLELWKPDGTRRTISLADLPRPSTLNPNLGLLFRADGKAAFITVATGPGGNDFTMVGVDLESQATAVLDWVGYAPAPGTSVRITAPGI